MANLTTPQTSHLSYHLSDPTLIPILTSAQSPPQRNSLTSLTSTALTAYDSASRLGLGLPQRIMIESSASGPLILHSYIPPPSTSTSSPTPAENRSRTSTVGIVEQAREGLRPLSGDTDVDSDTANSNSHSGDASHDGREEEGVSSGQGLATGMLNGVSDFGAQAQEAGSEGGGSGSANGGQFAPPLLIATVLAGRAEDAAEARRLAGRMERVGREFQREWSVSASTSQGQDREGADVEDG